VSRSQCGGSPTTAIWISRLEPLCFLPNSSSVALTTCQKIWWRRKSNPAGPLDLQPGTLSTRPQRRSTFFYITYINSVRTSQETQYISILQPGTLTTRPQTRSTFFYITYINSVRISQETQYISILQPGTLTTRPQTPSTFFYITYINSVRTSQETQYISVV
jgi:multisubunit Na+/H+ antiporter MnhE subunit